MKPVIASTVLVLPMLFAAGPASAQCPPGAVCGQAGGAGNQPSNTPSADESRNQCLVHFADLGTHMLKGALTNTMALNAKARANQAITVAEIGANPACAATCAKYGNDRYNWATYGAASVAYQSEPAKSLQQQWHNKPAPPLPDVAELSSCYPTADFVNWCPPAAQSGPVGDLGNGPVRLKSPIDDLPVCAQPAAQTSVLKLPIGMMMHAKDCGKYFEPDALKRYDEEVACMKAADTGPAKAANAGALGAAAINPGTVNMPAGPRPPEPVKRKGP
jgi:hypothetical protein